MDRHDHHSDGSYPLAHHPVTSFAVSGPVRFPLDLRRYGRDEELTQWEAAVARHVPDVKIPTEKKAWHRLHKQVDLVLLQYPEFWARHEPFQTTIALAIELMEGAIRHKAPCGVVVFDAWDLVGDLFQVLARRGKDWISLLNTNRLLETASVLLQDANGWTLQLPGHHLAVEELVPLLPATAYRRSHWDTLVSGRRGRLVAAPDVSACGTGSNAGSHPHHGRRLSATGACVAAAAVGLRP